MNRIQNIIALLFFILIFYPAFLGHSQDSGTSLQFDKTTHDFGTIQEENGSVACTFKFVNNGTSDLTILEVLAECGCTTPDWTQGVIQSGEEGLIKTEYDPANRPGPFNKSLTVIYNNYKQEIDLYITGNVISRPRSIEEEYPIEMGGIRVKHSNINFRRITNEKPVKQTILVYNDMNKRASWDNDIKAPDNISVKFIPESMPPKSVGTIEITYDPRGIELLGYKGDKLVVWTNEWFDSKKTFRVVAFLEEYFTPLSADELAQAPKLKIENPIHNFGKIAYGASVSHDFVITNTGQKDLNIRMARTSCGCTTPELQKNNLKPGESTLIKVTLNTEGKNGNQNEIVLVFSNDPINPTRKMTIKGYVENEGTL